MASVAAGLRTPPTGAARLQQTRSRLTIAAPLAALRAPAGRAAAATAAAPRRHLLGPPARPPLSHSGQRHRRARVVQHTTSALGAIAGARAGGGAPQRRGLIPPALLARLSVTLLLVWLVRLGHYIPLPGVHF